MTRLQHDVTYWKWASTRLYHLFREKKLLDSKRGCKLPPFSDQNIVHWGSRSTTSRIKYPPYARWQGLHKFPSQFAKKKHYFLFPFVGLQIPLWSECFFFATQFAKQKLSWYFCKVKRKKTPPGGQQRYLFFNSSSPSCLTIAVLEMFLIDPIPGRHQELSRGGWVWLGTRLFSRSLSFWGKRPTFKKTVLAKIIFIYIFVYVAYSQYIITMIIVMII